MNNSEHHETTQDAEWFEDYADQEDDLQIDEYDITATPNDFNILTIFNFIESGAVVIPGFQRNYVWDAKRASKLVESLILGLPVPQVFLYEERRNRFLVIDGQQRLLSIYYFMKQRFPRKERRVELRKIFDQHGMIPDEVLHNDAYFSGFGLTLPEKITGQANKFKGLNYSTLGEYKTQYELRPIRNIIVKQNSPKDDNSSIYEIFSRLNSGGINLRAQEIRTSLYHSRFYDALYRINSDNTWRRLLRSPLPDLHMKDIEILLRAFAMLIDGDDYTPSMTKFLNQFSKKCQSHSEDNNSYLEKLFESFLVACGDLPDDAFLNKRNNKFNFALFEAVFAAVCARKFKKRALVAGVVDVVKIMTLENDSQFLAASLEGTTKTANVAIRLERAKVIVGSL